MIFNITKENINTDESYKERNLYYKIFAGYLFNELIVGYESRKEAFVNLLIQKAKIDDCYFGSADEIIKIVSGINKSTLHTTFDYHTAQIFQEDKRNDRGEMSDVLLISEEHIISIECKFLSDINFDKDIKEVQSRIKKYSLHFKRSPIQILLLKQVKWFNSKRIKNELITYQGIPIVVLFWEDILVLINEKRVKEYLEVQLERN